MSAVVGDATPSKTDGFKSPFSVRKCPFSVCRTEFRSCVKVEVAVLGSLSLISLMVSVDVRQH